MSDSWWHKGQRHSSTGDLDQSQGTDLESWTCEQLSGFLTDVGRRLCDKMVNTDGMDSSFIFYISIRPGSSDGFSLRTMMAMSDSMSDKDGKAEDLPAHIAHVQQTLLNYFLDRFRNMAACRVHSLLKSLPLEWWLPAISRTDCQSRSLSYQERWRWAPGGPPHCQP